MTRTLLVVVLCSANALAAPPGNRSDRLDRRQRLEQQRFEQTLQQLSREVEQIRFEDTPLEEAIRWCRDQGLDSIAVLWTAIEQHTGVQRDTPITLSLPSASLGEVLDWILIMASQEAVDSEEQLTFHIDRGVLVIASARYFNGKVIVRIYDIAAVVQPVPFWGAEGPQLSGRHRALLQRSATVDVDGGRRSFKDPAGPCSSNGRLQDLKEAHVVELMDALFQLKPETWEREGGRGWIRRFKDRLIVAQTIEVHEMIGGNLRPGH